MIAVCRFKNVRHHVRYWNPRSVVNKLSQRSSRCNQFEKIVEQVHTKRLRAYREVLQLVELKDRVFGSCEICGLEPREKISATETTWRTRRVEPQLIVSKSWEITVED
ncbi:hypothetical protein QQ045_021447 [Rhodiola kirilowii]